MRPFGPGLYVHIPFCRKKCPYCSFYSIEPDKLDSEAESLLDDYVQALLNQARVFASLFINRPFGSLYLGGGTPSLLGARRINDLVSSLFDILEFTDNPEITIEVNPNDASLSFFYNLKKRVNRVSLGLQSFKPSVLETLGRTHSSFQAHKALQAAVEAGLNVSGDLIFNVPGQSLSDFASDLEQLITAGVVHISLYDLHVEPQVPMYPLRGQDEELNTLMYEYALKRMNSAGIHRYEVSNFSVPGYESRHNLVYWSGLDFLGLGPGASGMVRPFKIDVKKSVLPFIETYKNYSDQPPEAPDLNKNPEDQRFFSIIDKDSLDDQMDEFMFMGLRKSAGVSDLIFRDLFKHSFYTIYNKSIKNLVSKGLLYSGSSRIGLTEKGFMLGNRVFMEFIR